MGAAKGQKEIHQNVKDNESLLIPKDTKYMLKVNMFVNFSLTILYVFE
jgi:hypothetical protein